MAGISNRQQRWNMASISHGGMVEQGHRGSSNCSHPLTVLAPLAPAAGAGPNRFVPSADARGVSPEGTAGSEGVSQLLANVLHQQLAKKPSSIHISVPSENRSISHTPSPCLAAGAKRTLLDCSSQLLKLHMLSGMASKTTSTIPPKCMARSPSLQSLKKSIIPKDFRGKIPMDICQRYLNLFIEECLKFCSSNQEATKKALGWREGGQ
ncbi:RNA exonuclease 1 like protein [Myotis davidii]|uniref:RNA exonuclease 1 like protein n=1 Tax=Myotis davidii TaxID=225400 RepID=L5M9N7_MYODS|nr:RNA exonuclease 1 like protein [Myotis davidii]